MTSSVRWLHLSDFHVGKDDYAQRQLFENILSHVDRRCNDGFRPDLVFVTGDLADRGLADEHSEFWLSFAAPLFDILGHDIEERLFVVPGNHDVDRTRHQAFDRAEMLLPSSRYLDPTIEGSDLRSMLVPRFASFADNGLTTRSRQFLGPEGATATIVSVNGSAVGIAGINTAWFSKDEDDKENLSPGKGLLESALKAVSEGDLRIVLGHHPVDWMISSEQRPLKALLARYNAIYLHGHLHYNWTEPIYGSGATFLAIQAGAAFQAREGEAWKNGLLWADAELSSGILRLQPMQWVSQHQEWTLVGEAYPESLRDPAFRDGGWWAFALPGTERAANARTSTPIPATPSGWTVRDRAALSAMRGPLAPDIAVNFFDGAVPGWEAALSESVPRRDVVERLVASFAAAEQLERSVVTLLLAPACEGKTTALLQAAWGIIEHASAWHVLWRTRADAPLDVASSLRIVQTAGKWLIVIDDADLAAESVIRLLNELPTDQRPYVHVLLASRDSDWLAAGAGKLPWSTVSAYHEERLSGLALSEAKSIVAAWNEYGEPGLGEMASVEIEDRAERLHATARDALSQSTEAFFGALLAVRHGSDIEGHARSLITRLASQTIASGGTLADAMGYIAAVHAEGLELLSRPVLAQVLGCPPNRLHRDVVSRLGQEAATATTSSFLMTRHERIAKAVTLLAEREFGEDLAEVFAALVAAALAVGEADYVPRFADWRYKLPRHFLETGRPELALKIATVSWQMDARSNAESLVFLASMHRESGDPEGGCQLFRRSVPEEKTGRSFYYEWSVCEGNAGRWVTASALAVYSLSDQVTRAWVDNHQAKLSLAGAAVAFERLAEAYGEPLLRQARVALAVMGASLPLDRTSAFYFREHLSAADEYDVPIPTLESALSLLVEGQRAAETIDGNEELCPPVDDLTFQSLLRLLGQSF